jgi:Flp pilus assembly protein TadB
MTANKERDLGPRCPTCGGRGAIGSMVCRTCGAKLRWRDESIEVTGTNADDVLRVTKDLVEQRAERNRLASPWVSGSFYLCCVVVVIAVMLVAGKVLSVLALPIVVVASVLLVTMVGAFQQRQDQRLSEKTFLQLMLATLKNLPIVIGRRGAREPAP